jgi:transcriptional regulator with XRE-family HTH domain
MISQDMIEKIQKLKTRRYTQEKVAEQLGLSRSTVARYWGDRKGTSLDKRVSKDDVVAILGYFFQMGRCSDCGITYPKPKFLPEWKCPKCRATSGWGKCWYK